MNIGCCKTLALIKTKPNYESIKSIRRNGDAGRVQLFSCKRAGTPQKMAPQTSLAPQTQAT